MILHPITQELLANPRVQSAEFLKDLCVATIAIYPQGLPVLPWVGYLAEEDGEFVGTCAFKGLPNLGEVEIAYFTFPGHEGRGVATRMAQHLVELARTNGVTIVKAQTLPKVSSSTRVLEKLGFHFAGPIIHPEDGEVWEWRR